MMPCYRPLSTSTLAGPCQRAYPAATQPLFKLFAPFP